MGGRIKTRSFHIWRRRRRRRSSSSTEHSTMMCSTMQMQIRTQQNKLHIFQTSTGNVNTCCSVLGLAENLKHSC